jgi:hypothetical protein
MQNIRLLFGQDAAQSGHADWTSQAEAQNPDASFAQARKPGPVHGLIRRAVEDAGYIVATPGQRAGEGGALDRAAALDGVVGVDHHDAKRLFSRGHACEIEISFIRNRHHSIVSVSRSICFHRSSKAWKRLRFSEATSNS